MGRCSVIYKDNGLLWIQICARMCQEIIKTRYIHFADKTRGKHESIDRRYCDCHSQVSCSLAANLAIGPLFLPCSTMTSRRRDVVAAFVYDHTMLHYGIVHKPCCVVDSLVQHIRSVSVSRGGRVLPVSLETASRLMSLRSWIYLNGGLPQRNRNLIPIKRT